MARPFRRARRPRTARRLQPAGAERDLLQYIADHADMITMTYGRGAQDADFRQRFAWVLVPLPAYLLDQLETFGADRDGLEDDREGDDRCDDELTWTNRVNQAELAQGTGESDEGEDDGITEYDIVKPDTMDRTGLEDWREFDPLAAKRRERERAASTMAPTPGSALGSFVRL